MTEKLTGSQLPPFFDDLLDKVKWELEDYERGYLEAVIDADGRIGISRSRDHSFAIKAGVQNTCVELLRKVKLLCRDEGTIGITAYPSETREKTVYEFCMYARTVEKVLPQLRLVVKERQRVLALEMRDRINNYKSFPLSHEEIQARVELWEECKELNKKRGKGR